MAKLTSKNRTGTPWSQIESVEITVNDLNTFGKMLVEEVVAAAKVDFAKRRKGDGGPQGLPDSPRFFKSFSYQIKGSSVEVTSNWPWIEDLTTGKKPFKMTWLTRKQGAKKIPIVQRDGRVVIRSAPVSTAKAWIHPGIAKHGFIERGVRKAQKKFAPILLEKVKQMLMNGKIG